MSSYKVIRHRIWLALFFCFVNLQAIADENLKKEAQAVETVGEVSIIGNTELPNVSFNLPWRLPTVENREEQSPRKELANTLEPLEPKWHQQSVHFSRFLKLEIPEFSKR